MNSFSPKQREVWRESVEHFHRWNISCGAARSGKTYLEIFRLPYRIRHAPEGGIVALIGNTRETLERNLLTPLRDFWSEDLVGRAGSGGKIRLFGRECWLLGAGRGSEAEKLQGTSVSYCCGDEVTTWNEEVFQMLKSRMDKPGACFDGSCNPCDPGHWLKKFIDSGNDVYYAHFTIEDNPFLDPNFVESLKAEYSGSVYYDRFIKGLWTAAEGAIYRPFLDAPESFVIDSAPPIISALAGMDFGGNGSAHALNVTGFTAGYREAVTLCEYYSRREMSPIQLENEVCDFLLSAKEKYPQLTDLYCDSAEQVLIRGLRSAMEARHIPIAVHNAKKLPINDRIRFYTRLMGAGRYKIMRGCEHTIEAFSTAVWDGRIIGRDVRLDDGSRNIDSLDAQEYSTESVMRYFI